MPTTNETDILCFGYFRKILSAYFYYLFFFFQKIAEREKTVVALSSKPVEALKTSLLDPPFTASSDDTRVLFLGVVYALQNEHWFYDFL